MLSSADIDSFIHQGFVKISGAFSEALADECADILWKHTGYDRTDNNTWMQPVVRINELMDSPFVQAANSLKLSEAFDQLIGIGKWLPRRSMGSFPIRFPHPDPALDTGWHVDASFPGEDAADYMQYRINVYSQGRALLMLFLFSDVGNDDAPTRIAVGSHLSVAALLNEFGKSGLSFLELAEKIKGLHWDKEVLATGIKGTVYLCHPFLIHAAQSHRGNAPRFMAQPPLFPSYGSYGLEEGLSSDTSPLMQSIRLGIGK